ncbi:hypothetical protein HYC85_016267 [Camellia sinensis]|uniref:RNA helicase n=1 Tax=Camellia sinensis TaxID=4442 RepID=A0A7J7GZ87_CAMSI|nr:hypothetical protein HYC85_016267 [Camellia sinensis]
MSLIGRERCDDDFSVIGDKGEIGFLDFEDDKSLCAYDPNEEGPVLISIPFPFIRGKPLSVFVGETSAHPITIQNTTRDERIERVVFVLAEDKISRSLASKKPYSRFPRRKQFATNESAKTKTRGLDYKLPLFEIPMGVRELVENKQVPEVITQGLMKENYATYFNTLLNMEELHLEKEMRCHDMERITMRRKGANLLALAVPGLAERRPSLVHGDFAFAMLAFQGENDTSPPYQGIIHRIEADDVLLKFSKNFHMNYQVGVLYNIRFSYNRVNMRRLYHAVQAAESLDTNFLFPSQSTKRLIKMTQIVPFTPLNEEQQRAVETILGCEGAPPYVIHGPPGQQSYNYMQQEKMLMFLFVLLQTVQRIISWRNLSIMKRLGSKRTRFRLNATSRSYEDVQANNIRFCFFEDFIFKCPPLMALMHYRVIVSTYMSSSLLYVEGICCGHFSHVFLDEASQASEPEAMVPISNLCESETVVVLAGDPMQLGPVVYSKDAKVFGLGKSYLERLFGCEYYHNRDESFITKLVRNYRCHPAILHVPSKLFYRQKLLACKEDTSSLKSWLSLLPNKEFPVLFIGIQGCDEREGNDPSWFNRIEASKVVDIVKKLRGSEGLREEDIGVIAPYRQQVVKITNVLESFDMGSVKVGSVEQFQGQEREVIIVSTVRSTAKHNGFDKTYCLGFLSNPRRFNVAVTRAKSLLIIVGNPHIVSKDPYWHKLLWHCFDNNSYQGCPLPERRYYAYKEPNLEDNWNYEGGPQSLLPVKLEVWKLWSWALDGIFPSKRSKKIWNLTMDLVVGEI